MDWGLLCWAFVGFVSGIGVGFWIAEVADRPRKR